MPSGSTPDLPDAAARLAALRRTAAALAETDRLQSAFQIIVDAAVQALPAQCASLYSLDLLKNQVELIVHSAGCDPLDPTASATPPEFTLTAPVIYCERMLGMIKAVQAPGAPPFSAEDQALLAALAGQAAQAIESDHLRRMESRQRRQAETLREVARVLISSLDQQQVLELILDQVARVIAFDSASIMLLHDQRLVVGAVRNFKTDEQHGITNPLQEYAHIAEAIERRRPVMIEDTRYDARWRATPGSESIRCWLGVPLIGRERVIGVLNLDKDQPGYYTRADARLAAIFATQAAVAIENARMYTTAREAAERRSVLHQVSQAILTASLRPEEIYSAVHAAVARLMPAEAFVITRYQPGALNYEAVYQVDRGQRFPGGFYPANQGLFGRVIAGQQTVYLPDLLESHLHEQFPHFGSRERVRSVLSAPMRLRNQVVGMIAAQSYRPHAYTPDDQSLLEMLAAYAALALDNAALLQNIQQLAITDPLTGLFNRRQLFELGQREFARARRFERPLSVWMLDIDFFKQVNDRFSHATGDRVLRRLAAVLKDGLREIDMVGRYGGEEFIVILPETRLETALEIANRLRDRVVGAFRAVSLPAITVSIGVAALQPDVTDFNDLVHRADLALYTAKRAGRNRVATLAD